MSRTRSSNAEIRACTHPKHLSDHFSRFGNEETLLFASTRSRSTVAVAVVVFLLFIFALHLNAKVKLKGRKEREGGRGTGEAEVYPSIPGDSLHAEHFVIVIDDFDISQRCFNGMLITILWSSCAVDPSSSFFFSIFPFSIPLSLCVFLCQLHCISFDFISNGISIDSIESRAALQLVYLARCNCFGGM